MASTRLWRDDGADPAATRREVAAKIADATAAEWTVRLSGKDVCCAIVASIEEALGDPHFQARGVFARKLAAAGRSMPALPVPVDPRFRGEAIEKDWPALGEANPLLDSC